MEFLTDWRLWGVIISALTFIGVVISGIINKISSDKIANNHLAHIAEDVKIVIAKQENQAQQINELKIDVAYIKGKTKIK